MRISLQPILLVMYMWYHMVRLEFLFEWNLYTGKWLYCFLPGDSISVVNGNLYSNSLQKNNEDQ